MPAQRLTEWPKPAASIMVFRDGCVLLGQRAKPPLRGLWSLPGGHIEPGETVNDAALRELSEETGVTAAVTGHAATRDIIVHDDSGTLTAHYVLTVLIGTWLSGEPRAASDCLAARWVAMNDLDRYDMTNGTTALIESVWRNGTGNRD